MRHQISLDMTTIIIVSLIIFSLYIALVSHLFPYQIKTATVIETLALQTKINYAFFLVNKSFSCIDNKTCAIVYLPKYVNLIIVDHSDIGTLMSKNMEDYYNGLIFHNKAGYINIIKNRQFCISILNVTNGITKYNITISYVYRSGICTAIYENGTEVISNETNCVCKFPSTYGTGGTSYIFFNESDPHGIIESSIFPEIVSKYGIYNGKNALIIGNFTINRSCVYFLLYNLIKNYIDKKPFACEYFANSPSFSFCLARYILNSCSKNGRTYSILVVPLDMNITDYINRTKKSILFSNKTVPPFIVNLSENQLVFPYSEECSYDLSGESIDCKYSYYINDNPLVYFAILNTKFFPSGGGFTMNIFFDIRFNKKPYNLYFDGCPIINTGLCKYKTHKEFKGEISCYIPITYSTNCYYLEEHCKTIINKCE